MRILTRKAVVDVTRRKGRTILMILGIFIGVLGLAAMIEATDLITGSFFYITDPEAVPHMVFTMDATMDQLPSSMLTTIQHLPNVEQFQLRTTFNTVWHIPGARNLTVIEINGYQDVDHIHLNTFELTSGRMPGQGEIVMDVSDQALQSIAIGDTIRVDTAPGHTILLRVVGLARTRGMAVWHPPAPAVAYMRIDVLQQLVQATGRPRGGIDNLPRGVQVLIKTQDSTKVKQTYDVITQVLNNAHIKILFSNWHYPNFDADTELALAGLLNIIQLLTFIILLLVCVMIITSMSTLLTEQIKIIGTMKAMGGTRWRIIGSYLLTVSIYSVIGTALGLGLGLVAGYQLVRLLTSLVRVDVGPFEVAPWVVISSLSVGLLAPLFAALWPLWVGTRITVREAIAAYGVRAGTNERTHVWGRQLHWVPQTVWLGLRGIFRKPGRAALTLLSLTLSGTIFMAVQVTNASLGVTGAHDLNVFHSDLRIDPGDTGQTVSTRQVVTTLQALPNVERVEAIDRVIITIAQSQLSLFGLPADTRLYQPQVVAGHWLRAHEQKALVINDYAAQRLKLHVGDHVTVITSNLDAQQTEQATWTIVGIVHDIDEVSGSANPRPRLGLAFTTLDNLNRTLRHLPADASLRLWLQALDHSDQGLQNLQNQVQGALGRIGFDQPDVRTLQQLNDGLNPLLVLDSLFYTVAILVGLVGLLGLSHTLAASVLERRLEIGILRSLGATGRRVGTVFCVEGLALAMIAWALGIILGLPTGVAIMSRLGIFFGAFDLSFNPLSILVTLLFVVVVAFVASFGPALSASRMRIREILHYE